MKSRKNVSMRTLKMEGDHSLRQAGGLWELDSGFSPGFSREDHSPASILILIQEDPFWASGLQNAKIINAYCLRH